MPNLSKINLYIENRKKNWRQSGGSWSQLHTINTILYLWQWIWLQVKEPYNEILFINFVSLKTLGYCLSYRYLNWANCKRSLDKVCSKYWAACNFEPNMIMLNTSYFFLWSLVIIFISRWVMYYLRKMSSDKLEKKWCISNLVLLLIGLSILHPQSGCSHNYHDGKK